MRTERRARWWLAGPVLAAWFLGAVVLVPAGAAPAAPSAPPATPATPATAAAGGFDFGVEPYTAAGAPVRGAFEYDVTAGQTINDRVTLINETSKPKSLLLYGADAFTAEVGGGFALRPHTDPLRDAGAWIGLPVSQYTIPPNTIALVPVSLNTPPDATPGDHIAGIVAEEIAPNIHNQSGEGLLTVHRVAARVYLRVAGVLRPELSVQDYHIQHSEPLVPFVTGHGSEKIIFTVANTGNVRVKLDKVTVRVTGLLGRSVHQSSLARAPVGKPQTTGLPDELLPGSKVVFSRQFQGVPPVDQLTVHVDVLGHDPVLSSNIRTSRSEGYWDFPWLLAVIAALLIGVYVWYRRRRRLRAEREAQPEPGSPPSVATPETQPPAVVRS